MEGISFRATQMLRGRRHYGIASEEADGSVVLPDVLVPYMGGLKVIAPRV